MSKKMLHTGLVLVVAMALSINAFARDNDHDRGHNFGHDRDYGHDRYHYRGGHWYHRGLFGWDFAVAALTLGAIVDALPGGYTTVVVGGNPYYYYDRVYYRPCPQGYVVVQEPSSVVVVNEQAVAQPVVIPTIVPQAGNNSEVITINVPNSRGGYTSVKLIKHNDGYIGPQGEYYDNPTVDQLKALYGK